MTDEQRCDSLRCYGSGWSRTPAIDTLSAEGVRFSNAYTQAPVCIPARTAIFSARYPGETGVLQNSENPRRVEEIRSALRFFSEAGYRTASFGKQHYDLDTPAFEHEEQIVISDLVDYTRYASTYDEDDYDVVKYPGPTSWILSGRFPGEATEMAESVAVDRASDWLRSGDSEQPFFLRISFNGPHTPVAVPAPWCDSVDGKSVSFPDETELPPGNPPKWLSSLINEYSGSERLSREDVLSMRSRYYGYVLFLDEQVARLTTLLDQEGVRDNTIIVYTSDHGTHLGDYGLVQKQTFFEPTARVPYIISVPNAEKAHRGAVVDTPVETRSLIPTLLGLCRIKHDGEDIAEISLERTVSGGIEPDPHPVFSEFTLNPPVIRTQERIAMVRAGAMKLVVNVDNSNDGMLLFDLEKDPLEQNDVSENASYSEERRKLQRLLEAHVASW